MVLRFVIVPDPLAYGLLQFPVTSPLSQPDKFFLQGPHPFSAPHLSGGHENFRKFSPHCGFSVFVFPLLSLKVLNNISCS